MTLGSLFDGIGGFPLAGSMYGITPLWAAEIEPFPIRVTKARFPDMMHLGSVTEIDGGKIPPVDVITFGSPCQDLSVAGLQKGIHGGTRSNLFFEAIRIIKEMRASDRAAGRADEHCRPRFAVWENVPGAFSSQGGEDFRAVLQAFCSIRGGATILYLDLRRVSGGMPAASWEKVGALPGVSMMLNTGPAPHNAASASTLSQILQADAPEKYYLSQKACAGILRRAEKRGKKLPQMLRDALEEVVQLDLRATKAPAPAV